VSHDSHTTHYLDHSAGKAIRYMQITEYLA
jgi:hypothetical protein